MRITFINQRIAAVFIIAAVVLTSALSPTFAAPDALPSPAIPGVVTSKDLTTLRATARMEELHYPDIQTDQGPLPDISKGTSTQGAASTTLKLAFPSVPFCQEWACQASSTVETIFPFAVEANERLVDALDKLKRNSNGFMDWRLLHGRIILSATDPSGEGATSAMNRLIHVELQANTLLEAFVQIEAAYNDQFPKGAPLVNFPMFFNLEVGAFPSGTLALKTENTLREIVLTVMDQMQDSALCYGLSESAFKGGHYLDLHALRYDCRLIDSPSDSVAPVSTVDIRTTHTIKQVAEDRLERYFNIRAEAAERSDGIVGGAARH
jgi:hypothetical protein